MLTIADRFLGMPVMSLQTGAELARTVREVIDPRDLTIIAYELAGPMLDQTPSLLRVADIREIGSLGMIVDSVDELISPSDVIKIQQVYNYQFTLLDKIVVDEANHKLGKVTGYTLQAGNFVIQQLVVRRPFLKSFNDTELLVHRSQISKVTDDLITVRAASITQPQKAHQRPTDILPAYDNPFRKRPQPDSIDNK